MLNFGLDSLFWQVAHLFPENIVEVFVAEDLELDPALYLDHSTGVEAIFLITVSALYKD